MVDYFRRFRRYESMNDRARRLNFLNPSRILKFDPEESSRLLDARANNKFLCENMPELIKQYPGKAIAVYNQEVVAVHDYGTELWNVIEEKGYPADRIMMTRVRRPDEVRIHGFRAKPTMQL